MSDYSWDDFDAQTAEYLNSSPTYSNWEWSDPNALSWLQSYADTPSLLQTVHSGALDDLVSPVYGQSLAAWAQTPTASGLLANPLFNPSMSFRTDDGSVVGDLSSGADVSNPYEYVTAPNGETYVVNKDTRQTVGYLGEDLQPHSYQEEAFGRGGTSQSDSSWAEKAAKAALQAQARAAAAYNRQQQAKEAYSQSGVGQALTGLAGALSVAQALLGKNQGATTTSRGNQGSNPSVSYQGSSAPKTLYASGGEVKGGLMSVTEQMLSKLQGLIPGEAGGQDDVVNIKAAPGEYIIDAEAVSALGDGNTEEGARKLDELRMNLRKHKRTGGLSSIPPKAKRPEQYLKKGK